MQGQRVSRAIGVLATACAVIVVAVATTQFGAAPPATAQTAGGVTLHEPETARANGADLRWSPYTGVAFTGYEIHRGTTSTFTPSASTLLTTILDPALTVFQDTTAGASKTYTYKVVVAGAASQARTVALPASQTAVKTLQPAAADGKATFIQKAASGSVSCVNNGARDKLFAAAQAAVERPLVQFDLSDLPAGATITSATVSLYRETTPSRALTVDAHPVKAEWKEGTGTPSCSGTGASWDETEGGDGWAAKGGDIAPTATTSVALASGVTAGWDTFDVQSLAQDWADGKSPNLGMLLKLRDETLASGNIVTYASDDAVDATRRPKLVVAYTDPSAKPQGPAVEISSPEDDALVGGSAVTLTAAAGDDRRVQQVQFLVDGAVVATDTAAPWTATWSSLGAANGTHNVLAKATDDVGNVVSSSRVYFTVGNSAQPAAKVTSPSSAYADVVRATPAAGHWRLGETAGTTVADASGNGRSGTLSGTYVLGQASLLTNDANPAIKLRNASTDGRVTVTGLSGQLGSTVTAEAWADTTAVASTSGVSRLVSRGWGSAGGWRLGVSKGSDGQQRASFTVNVAGVEKTMESVISPGRHHLAGRYSGASVGLFVDGVYKGSVSVASQALNTTASVFLGETLLDDVVVDEAAVYGHAISTDEGRRHWEVGTGRTPTLNGANEPVVSDASDDRTIDKVEFFVDGERFGVDTTVPYDADLDTGDVDQPVWNGTHTVTSKAYDDHGQEKDSTTSTVVVDNTGGNPKYKATLTSTPVPQAVEFDPARTTQLDHGIDVTVRNDSPAAFAASDVVVRPRWISPDPAQPVVEGTEVPLAADLAAGAAATRRINVKAPALPAGTTRGEYTLRLDLYSKSNASYFAAKGNKPHDNPVIVDKAISGNLGLEKFWQYDGEQLGGGMQHMTNVANGNSLVRLTPLMSTGRGLSTVVDLTYNALEDRSESPVGNNWSLAVSGLTRFGNPIDIHPNKADELGGRAANRFVDLTDGDGTTHRFIGRTAADGTVYWEEPAGVHLYLRSLGGTDTTRRWALTRPDRVTYYYDADGFPTSVEDRNGNRIAYTLEATPPGEDPGGPKKRITAVTDAGGGKYTFEYWTKANAQKPHVRGKVRRIADHTGSELTFQYYDDGNLLRIAQTGGSRGDGSPLSTRAWYFTYTTSNGDGPAIPLAADRQHPDPKTSNQSTRLFSVRDPRKYETTFTYLGSGNGNDRWKLASRTARDGGVTSFGYDTVTRTTTVAAPEARTSKYAYDTEGKVTAITNPKNEVTQIAFSADRHVERVTQPTGKYKEYRYNANGQITDVWNELRNHTKLEYQDVAVDANDASGKWKAGRAIPHVSQLAKKTDPKGTATATPADDYQWSWSYDPKGNPSKAIDPENAETEFFYHPDGTTSKILDPNDNPVEFPTYHASGQPTKMVDGEGRTTQFGYDADGFMTWIQDPEHVDDTGTPEREYRTEFKYDSWHRLDLQSAPKSTAAARKTLVWSAVKHDANDNVIEEIAPHYGQEYPGTGAKETYQYDRMDRLERVYGSDKTVDAEGERWRFSYDLAGRMTQQTDPRGMATIANDRDGATYYAYDKLDRIEREWRELLEGSTTTVKEVHRRHYCYDGAGDLRAIVPPNAAAETVDCADLAALPRATLFEYDDAHRLTSERDPLGHRRGVTYDANGRTETSSDENQQTTRYEYDERGLVTKVIEPFETGRTLTSLRRYDPAGNLKEEVSPRGWDASADKQTFAQYKTTYEYDRVNQVERVLLPTSAAHPEQHYVHRDYDRNGNARTITQPTTAATLATTASTDRTDVTHWDTGWVKSTLRKPQSRVHFDYTAEGWQRLRTPEKADGSMDTARQREWVYSADGDVREERVGTEELGYSVDAFDYDPNDQLVKAHDSSGLASLVKEAAKEVRVDYDSVDRETRVRERSEGEANWTATLSTYDPNGNVATRHENREETDAGAEVKAGHRHEYTYDIADWLQSHKDLGTSTSATDDRLMENAFHPDGREKERTVKHADATGAFQLKQTTRWEFFANGDLKNLTTLNGSGAVKEKHVLGYLDLEGRYANGHRTTDTYRLDGAQASDACKTADCVSTYVYDARDRVVEERVVRPGAADRTTKYTLDAPGNIRREERPGIVEVNEYTGSQMTKQTVTQGTASAAFLMHHDPASGNLLCVTRSGGGAGDCNPAEGTSPSTNLVQDYVYDAEDRLEGYRSFDAGSKKSSSKYDYDSFDRVSEQVEERTSFATPRATKFSYLGITADVSREEQFEHTVDGKLDETKTYSYDAYGRRTGLSDKTESDTAGGNPTTREYSYAFDVHGSVSLLLDDAGRAQASYGYTPYGESDDALTREKDPSDSTGAKSLPKENPLNPFRYTDKRLDPGSSTLDMGARRFGPDSTRFLQEDVYDSALADLDLSSDPLTSNRYSLAGGNPISFVEVDGHMVARDGGGTSSSSPTPSRRRSSVPRRRGSVQAPRSEAATGQGYRGMRQAAPSPSASRAVRRGQLNPTGPFGPLPGGSADKTIERGKKSCRGGDAVDCASGGAAGAASRYRQRAIDRNAKLNRSGHPGRNASGHKDGAPPDAKRAGKIAKWAGRLGPAASVVSSQMENEGLGRTALKTGASMYLGGLGVAAGAACGPLAVACSAGLGTAGGVVGNLGGEVASDVLDPVASAAGDLIGGDIGDGLDSLFGDG